jgi:hypothetical protein
MLKPTICGGSAADAGEPRTSDALNPDGIAVGVGDGTGVGVAVGVGLGVAVGVGLGVGVLVGAIVGVLVGFAVGVAVLVGAAVADAVGVGVGAEEGEAVAAGLAPAVGRAVGVGVGPPKGLPVPPLHPATAPAKPRPVTARKRSRVKPGLRMAFSSATQNADSVTVIADGVLGGATVELKPP